LSLSVLLPNSPFLPTTRRLRSPVSSDEKTLIDVLTPLDAFKVDLLARTYEGLVGKSLKETLEKELSGW
jgi:annexin A7/11